MAITSPMSESAEEEAVMETSVSVEEMGDSFPARLIAKQAAMNSLSRLRE